MAMACRAISHRGQSVFSASVLAYSGQAGPGLLNPMAAAASAGSLWGAGAWRASALPPASFTMRTSSRPWRCPGGARPALEMSRSAHTRVAGAVASQSAVVAEVMPAVPRVATAGAELLDCQGQGVGQSLGDVDRFGRVLQVGASQDHDCVLGAGVGPLVESAVHGGAAVLGDEDQLDATQLWQVGPGLGP